MNILYLNNEMTIGGVAKCILKLSKGLSNDNKIYIASKKSGDLLYEFKKSGIENIPIIDVKNKFPHNIILNIIKINKIVKNEQIDIIHSHHRMTTLLAKIASKFSKVKVIHTQHSIITDKKMFTKLTLRGIEVIAVSKAVKEQLINLYNLKADNISVIYNGIDNIKRKDIKEKNNIVKKNKENFYVGCISRLTKGKGIEILIKAASIINSENSNISFFIIGDGDRKVEFQNQCMNLSNIEFLGFKKNVIEYMKEFDLLIQPSFSEGLGLTAIEALSEAKPVIASNIPGLNEVVIDKYNGLLFEAGNENELVECIYKLYSDDKTYHKYSNNAIKYYNSNFNSYNYLLSHKNLYKIVNKEII